MARNPNLWANPTNRPAKLWNLTWDQYLSLDGALWKSILIAISVIIAMALFNTYELRGVNIFLTFLGYAFIWWFGLRPTHMAYSGVGGGIFATLFDRDKSQGVGSGPKLLFGVVKDVSYIFLLVGFSLFTWDFSGHIWAFWVVLAGVMILTQTSAGMNGWKNRIIIGYTLLCVVVSLWSTFGAYSGRSFDPTNGAPLYMIDPTTGRIDSEGRGPQDCASDCYSAETGTKLVPMTKEQALQRNPAAIGASAFDGVKKGLSNISLPNASLGGSACSSSTEVQVLAPANGYPGTQFELKRGCEQSLDASPFQIPGKPRIGVVVRLTADNPQEVLDAGVSTFYHMSTWTIDSHGRPHMKLVPNEGWPEGVKTIKLIVYPNNTK